MFHFFRTLFHDFPKLKLPVQQHRRKPIIVYSDASSNAHRGLGLVFIDTDTGQRLISDDVVPPDLLQLFGDRGSVINLAELLAILCAVLAFGERLRDRDVMCYVDNTSALSWAVHGTVNNPEASHMAHALHLSLASHGPRTAPVTRRTRRQMVLRVRAFNANPADFPSRAQDGFSPASRAESTPGSLASDAFNLPDSTHRAPLVLEVFPFLIAYTMNNLNKRAAAIARNASRPAVPHAPARTDPLFRARTPVCPTH